MTSDDKYKTINRDIILAQVKAGNTYENLPNEIRETVYSLHRTKKIIKIV